MDFSILYWPKWGLVLNIIGTFLIAFSFGKNPAEAGTLNKKYETIYLAAVLHPNLFWMGIIILAGGFAFSLFFN